MVLQAMSVGASTTCCQCCDSRPTMLRAAGRNCKPPAAELLRGAADATSAYRRSCNRSTGELQSVDAGAAKEHRRFAAAEAASGWGRSCKGLPPVLPAVCGDAAREYAAVLPAAGVGATHRSRDAASSAVVLPPWTTLLRAEWGCCRRGTRWRCREQAAVVDQGASRRGQSPAV